MLGAGHPTAARGTAASGCACFTSWCQELQPTLLDVSSRCQDPAAAAKPSVCMLTPPFLHLHPLVRGRLNLRENELESAGAAAVAGALPSLPALQQLDIAANQVGPAGTLAVGRELVAGGRRTFERLVLDENYVTDDALARLRQLLGAAFGGDGCLSAEELEPDMAEDEEDEGDDEAMDDGAGDELAAALEKGARLS